MIDTNRLAIDIKWVSSELNAKADEAVEIAKLVQGFLRDNGVKCESFIEIRGAKTNGFGWVSLKYNKAQEVAIGSRMKTELFSDATPELQVIVIRYMDKLLREIYRNLVFATTQSEKQTEALKKIRRAFE